MSRILETVQVTNDSSPALRVTAASRRIDGRLVLDGVTLIVARGRSVALLGPNGAGKSSLLRAIAGRLRLDAGEVTVTDAGPADARRRGLIGIVPQDIALYDHLTVRENLEVLGRLAGVPARALNTRVEAALEWAGLRERAGTRVTTLSGGMRRRVNVVAGTLHEPRLLLLDEPTVGVDVDARTRLHEMLRELCRRGMGLLIATHDADEAAALCDEVALLHRGRVLVHDTVPAVIVRAFPNGREVSLTLEAPVPAAACRLLAQLGFTVDAGGAWIGRTAGAFDDVVPVVHQIHAAGARIVETRVAEPSLRAAVATLLTDGREEAAA